VAKKSKPCVFCQIVAGQSPAWKVQENQSALAILDINPFSKGHCLVIPKRHVAWWHQMNESETESVFKLARAVSHKLMKAFQPDFVMMYARGRRIPHTHLFLVPTVKGDLTDRYFNALEFIQESPPALACLRSRREMDEALRLLKKCK
jgi:histidine triad (HIT) family protein